MTEIVKRGRKPALTWIVSWLVLLENDRIKRLLEHLSPAGGGCRRRAAILDPRCSRRSLSSGALKSNIFSSPPCALVRASVRAESWSQQPRLWHLSAVRSKLNEMKAVKWLAAFPFFLLCSCCAFVPFPRWRVRLLSTSFETASERTGTELTDRC